MKKIALVYLNFTNLGDVVIYETARYLCEDILKKNGITDCEVIPVDIGLSSYKEKKKDSTSLFIRGILVAIKKIGLKLYKIQPELSEKILLFRWRHSYLHKLFAENEFGKLENADLIIFGGGGLIKFHRQNFHYFLNVITSYAQDHEIPVLINAQGVEGYDANNGECHILKQALNRKCVKYISTRDDLTMLQDCYVENHDIEVKKVCDPAFWTAETYGIDIKESENRLVGLNVIRPNIFGEYLYKIDKSDFMKLYYDIIVKLNELGFVIQLFSNGTVEDSGFIDDLTNTYPEIINRYNVSIAIPKNTRDLVDTIAGYERYIAVRLHASIIGTVLGIPNISLVWNNKQTLFGEQIGMEKNYLMKQDFNADTVIERLLDAEPYIMDETYKYSVYEGLEKNILKWI